MQDFCLSLPWTPDGDPAALLQREWLVTNGLGGYGSASVLGVATRRYHGLFVPNLVTPKGRHIMISRFDEEITLPGRQVRLGGGEFYGQGPEGQLETDTHRFLREFRLDHRIAVWVFEIEGRIIEKSVVMPHNQNTVCVHYRLLQGDPLHLVLRPFLSFRRHDADLKRGDEDPFKLTVSRGRFEVTLPDFPAALRFGVRAQGAVFVTRERDCRDLVYRTDRERGYEHTENSYSPGGFEVELTTEVPAGFTATTQRWESLDLDTAAVIAAERQRIRQLVSLAPPELRHTMPAQLVAAADQFIVLPGSRLEEAVLAEAAGGEVRTIIAGYHWFGDWGRDTMISLEGLTLCTGRHREGGAILRTFARYVKNGLLPNLFPEGEREALYHTIDASLWYFHAVARYVRACGDIGIVRELWPTLSEIIDCHVRGTEFGIGVDRDGLLRGGAAGVQLTWMDAKVDDWVVTPRRGKPVEIQALWFNALQLMAQWSGQLELGGSSYAHHAGEAQRSFNQRFWNAAQNCLFDVIDCPEGPRDDPSGRPNQIFSFSLDHPILEPGRWPAVLDYVREHLLTPFGLRTLSPGHPDYKRNYHGDLRARDAAYHQGTVWPWLMGHFIDAWLRVHPDRAQARTMLDGFQDTLVQTGIGSIAEIFDAEPPYRARGCIAQAWSVAEVLRAWRNTGPRVGELAGNTTPN